MRSARSMIAIGIAVTLGVTACTSSPRPTATAASASPSAAAPSSPPPASHRYTPGGASIGDSLFPRSGDRGYDATHYAITITYDPGTKKLAGATVVTATATQDLSRFDLDLHGLTVASVTVGGTAATFTRAADKLVITPPTGIDRGASFETRVVYAGVPRIFSDPRLGDEGFVSWHGGVLAQGEPDVASTWYPVNDHPLDKATYDITITAPSNLAALSNGVLAGKTTADAATTWHWRESKPMASYLAMVVIGRYRVVTSTHKGLPVVTAVDTSLPTSVDTVMKRTPEIIDFLATQFGPYPFDAEGGIVHTDTRFQFALENQTRPVYMSDFFTHGGDKSIVVAHELAHQWYGDSVSVADWKDVWLNEGFATYAEWLWTQHEGGPTPKQTFDRILAGKLPTQAAAEPTVATLFGAEVYVRGAATLEALRITVGDTVFSRIIRGWAAARKYGNGSTAQFIAYADAVSGKSLDAFFKPWLFENGHPPYPKRI